MVQLFILAVNLENNDLAFILACQYRVYFVISSETNLCSVKFHQAANLVAIAINSRRHAVNNISFTELVDHVKEITVGEKIYINHFVIIGQVILLHLRRLLPFHYPVRRYSSYYYSFYIHENCHPPFPQSQYSCAWYRSCRVLNR